MATPDKKRTIRNMLQFDPVSGKFTCKNHIVRKDRVINKPVLECDYCGTKFSQKRCDQRFCSEECREAWHRRLRFPDGEPEVIGKQCEICGDIFYPTRAWSKYCSEECRTESRRLKLVDKRQESGVDVE